METFNRHDFRINTWMGFAAFISEFDLSETHFWSALIGFNISVKLVRSVLSLVADCIGREIGSQRQIQHIKISVLVYETRISPNRADRSGGESAARYRLTTRVVNLAQQAKDLYPDPCLEFDTTLRALSA